MPGFLKDPAWITVIMTTTGVLVMLIIFVLQRRKRKLSYELILKTPIAIVGGSPASEFKILFRDKPLVNAYLIHIKLINSGSLPIRPEDITTPITIAFDKESRVHEVDISETRPKGLSIMPYIQENEIVIPPTLLNNGDSFTVMTIVDNFSDEKEISIDGRIVGVKEINSASKKRIMGRGLPFVLGIIFGLIVGFISTLLGWDLWPILAGTLLLLILIKLFKLRRRARSF